MADIALDSDGDMLFTGGNLQLAEGDDAIVQQLIIRFKFVLAEWFLDQRVGVPLIEEVLVKNPDLTRIRSIYTQLILTTPGIDSISLFELTIDNATMKAKLDFRAVKDDGTFLDFSEEFIVT